MRRGNFLSTNQKHYQDLGSTRPKYGISALVTLTSFCEDSSGDLAKRRLFSHANLEVVCSRCSDIGETAKNIESEEKTRRDWLLSGFFSLPLPIFIIRGPPSERLEKANLERKCHTFVCILTLF